MDVQDLIQATARGDVEAVRAHLAAHPEDRTVSSFSHGTLAHIAAREGQWPMMLALEALGVDMSARDEGDEEKYAGGETIFHAAGQGRARLDPSFLPTLLARYQDCVDIDAANTQGETALYQALARADRESARVLVERGATLPPRPWPVSSASEWLETWTAARQTEGLLVATLPPPVPSARGPRL